MKETCSPSCSCASAEADTTLAIPVSTAVARVNGQALQRADESLSDNELRQRACTELLRQAAQQAGLLSWDDVSAADGVPGEAAVGAIEQLLEQSLKIPEPSYEACRRHHAAHAARYR
ncbi:MAG: peptidylprolyl isomerase, partial [Burkholderiaceae bacterium]